jgi:hypothetical protein
MHYFLRIASIAMLCSTTVLASAADEISREKIKGLDEQVQDIKKDVLGISTELVQLEEKLIYPSNTQVSLFVALAPQAKFRLDAVAVSIDGKEATTHLYTHKELEALQSGGVQRLYTGNVRTGEHSLEVTLIGKTAGNADYREKASYRFTKAEGPRLVEITLADPGTDSGNIAFKDW